MSPLLTIDLVRTIQDDRRREARQWRLAAAASTSAADAAATAQRSGR
jgi:hypothetical protein